MITSEKVRYKLFEVRFKLDVEQKLKSGSERMLAAVPPGSSALVELESRMKECDAKVGLLQKAESKYKSLYFEDDDGATAGTSSDEKTGGLPSSGGKRNSTSIFGQEVPRSCGKIIHLVIFVLEIVHNGYKQSTLMFPVRNIRRPLTGKLYIRIGNANNLIGKKSSKTESLVIIKVDGTIKGTTRPSKGGKWNEDFVITVDKASEIELSVYEKGHSGNVLGLAWFKLWELDEAIMARRRIESESQSAAATGGSGGGSVGGVGTYNSTEAMLSFAGQMTTDGLESPLELEPSGKLGIRVRFVHELRSEKIKDGVVRRKNVKKVFPKRGHKFALQQFYQVIKCAACGDFLMSGQGLQCQCKKKKGRGSNCGRWSSHCFLFQRASIHATRVVETGL